MAEPVMAQYKPFSFRTLKEKWFRFGSEIKALKVGQILANPLYGEAREIFQNTYRGKYAKQRHVWDHLSRSDDEYFSISEETESNTVANRSISVSVADDDDPPPAKSVTFVTDDHEVSTRSATAKAKASELNANSTSCLDSITKSQTSTSFDSSVLSRIKPVLGEVCSNEIDFMSFSTGTASATSNVLSLQDLVPVSRPTDRLLESNDQLFQMQAQFMSQILELRLQEARNAGKALDLEIHRTQLQARNCGHEIVADKDYKGATHLRSPSKRTHSEI
eukprot:scaffold5350_cov178-Ochromonas_danica.AAC.3